MGELYWLYSFVVTETQSIALDLDPSSSSLFYLLINSSSSLQSCFYISFALISDFSLIWSISSLSYSTTLIIFYLSFPQISQNLDLGLFTNVHKEQFHSVKSSAFSGGLLEESPPYLGIFTNLACSTKNPSTSREFHPSYIIKQTPKCLRTPSSSKKTGIIMSCSESSNLMREF